MPARIVVHWLDGDVARSGGVESLGVARESGGQVWIDITDANKAAFDALSPHWSLHPVWVDDALGGYQRPKLDLYGGRIYLTWIIPELLPDDGLRMHKLDAFLGERTLITVHDGPHEAIDLMLQEADDALRAGAEWALHGVLDRAVDSVFPIVDALSDRLENLEDIMLADAEGKHLEDLYRTKRLLIAIRRIIGPERDVVRGMARQEALVSPEAYAYFQDVGDHLARVEDTVDTYGDVARGVMDIYLSATSNRLNVIMKRLTIVSTIFLPLTVMTGIYGMNFRYLPELQWRYGYFAVLGAMLAVVIAMLTYFKRRDWW